MPNSPILRAITQYLAECIIALGCYVGWIALAVIVVRLPKAAPISRIVGSEWFGLATVGLLAAAVALAVSIRGRREPAGIFAGRAGLWVWVPFVLAVAAGMLQMGDTHTAWRAYFNPPASGELGLYLIFYTMPASAALAYSAARAAFRRALRGRAARPAAQRPLAAARVWLAGFGLELAAFLGGLIANRILFVVSGYMRSTHVSLLDYLIASPLWGSTIAIEAAVAWLTRPRPGALNRWKAPGAWVWLVPAALFPLYIWLNPAWSTRFALRGSYWQRLWANFISPRCRASGCFDQGLVTAPLYAGIAYSAVRVASAGRRAAPREA